MFLLGLDTSIDLNYQEALLKPERLDATRRIFFCIIEQAIRMVRVLTLSRVARTH